MGKLHKLVAGTAVMSAVAIGFTTLADADIYTVKSGDTLWDIARNNGTTVDQLMKDNNLTSSLIFPGDKLSFQATVTQVAQAEESGVYTVVLGDTLFKIANQFGTTVDNLVSINKISNPNFIVVGQKLNVNGNAQVSTPVAAVPTVEKAVETPAPASTPVVETQKVEDAPAVTDVQPAPAVAETPAPAPAVEAPKVEVTPVANSNKAAAIYAAALAQIGVNQDCTMLVTNSLRAVGINFHGWPAGYMSLGTVIPADQAVPGDLVYYANGGLGYAHIAVYAGNGQAIHGGWFGNQTALASANIGSGPVYIRVA